MRLMPMHPIAFLVFAILMAGFLTLICYVKGEPPAMALARMKPQP
jgi:hypothetical protein